MGLRSSSYDPTSRSINFKWTEYHKSKIRIPKSKICFLKFLFFDQTGCPLAGGRALAKTSLLAFKLPSLPAFQPPSSLPDKDRVVDPGIIKLSVYVRTKCL